MGLLKERGGHRPLSLHSSFSTILFLKIMKTSLFVALIALSSMAMAATVPIEKRVECGRFKDPHVEEKCESICKKYGKQAEYLLGQCGRSGICECEQYKKKP